MLSALPLIILQVPGIDPTPFTAWGVLGLLGVVIIVLVGVIWKLFVRQSSSQETRDKVLMDFVDRHRLETTVAMKEVATTVAQSQDRTASSIIQSQDRMAQAFARQSRALDEVLLTSRVLDQIEKMKLRGLPLTAEEIDRVVRSVMHERSGRSET
jgi:hypothetical protein